MTFKIIVESFIVVAVIILINLTSSQSYQENDIPDYLHVCHQSDPELNKCVRKSIEQLRPLLADGLPDLKIPPIEPLLIPKITLKQDAGPMTITSEYTDIHVYGPSKFQIKGVRVDTVKDRIRIKLWFPELQMQSNYKIKGQLLLMPLNGNGTCQGNYTDVDAIAGIKSERIIINNREHFKVKDSYVEFTIGGATIKLDNLFNGDAELGKVMNQFLNDNWRSVAAEIRPALEDVIGNILENTADKLFKKYSIDQLLPK